MIQSSHTFSDSLPITTSELGSSAACGLHIAFMAASRLVFIARNKIIIKSVLSEGESNGYHIHFDDHGPIIKLNIWKNRIVNMLRSCWGWTIKKLSLLLMSVERIANKNYVYSDSRYWIRIRYANVEWSRNQLNKLKQHNDGSNKVKAERRKFAMLPLTSIRSIVVALLLTHFGWLLIICIRTILPVVCKVEIFSHRMDVDRCY